MNKLKIILPLALVIAVAIFASVFLMLKKDIKEVHYHAGFIVIENGKQKDFSDFKYMKVSPCNADGSHDDHVDEQLEKAHLHDQMGDVAHIERVGSKWKDLFTNIKYNIDYSKSEAYLNGKKSPNFQDLNINPYDSLVVLIGKNDVNKSISKAVKKDYIVETEKRSENCGT